MADESSATAATQATSQSSTAMVFDLDAALVRLDGDVELFGMLVALYQQDSVQLFQQLTEAAARQDLREVQRNAHSLKGLAANFDGLPAMKVAARIETAAREGDLEAASKDISELDAELERLRQALASFTAESVN